MFFKILLIISFFIPCKIFASEYFYILNDKCIKELYESAIKDLDRKNIEILKDSRGIILRFWFERIEEEYKNINPENMNKIHLIEDFLAKIENPVIIEVHTGKTVENSHRGLRNWEISTVVANKLGGFITKPSGKIDRNRIDTVGYGEFLPAKNTPNNGGKDLNRVDIIILCNVSGE